MGREDGDSRPLEVKSPEVLLFYCSLIALSGKPKWDRATNPLLEKPGGEGWLVGPEQQLFCQFKIDSATVHAQWVAMRTYRWIPPRPPVR